MASNSKGSCVSGSDHGSSHTTFVQADPSTFRAVVQKLTGAAEDPSKDKLPVTGLARQTGKAMVGEMGPRKPAFKLQERRQSMRKLEIKLGGSGGGGGGDGDGGSGSVFSVSAAARQRGFVGVGEMMLVSPVSPLDLFCRGSPRTPRSPLEEEDRAIAEKGFYLHPSPLSTPRSAEPELLPLFPLHSPRESTSS
ncbi:hypothetical protein HHK36_021381 [Tetracentron sinense]|uniref:VQ domain-containing protein n=1 Tax=Tetracentron sinense TaxID=13715 RepID=A0A834YS08_TETSI|nr:hypothetical protein HHK36_021381 [Tetracentron sinense]